MLPDSAIVATSNEEEAMAYKLATVQTAQGPRAGAVINNEVYEVAALTGRAQYINVQDVLDDWHVAHEALDAASISPRGQATPIAQAKLLAPLPLPAVIYCAGANYRDHSAEMWKASGRPAEPDPHDLGLKPWFFIKSPHSVVGTGVDIQISGYSAKMDWEVELAVVIGRKARNLTVETALSCVAGYTCANDLSARDLGIRPHVPDNSPFKADWIRHKSFDGACPLGPWIVPAQYIKDPTNLAIKLWVNDGRKQDSNSGNMIFTAAEQIAHLSSGITLHPGDVILTGTPAGVGAGQGTFLSSGDVVKIEIAEIGELSNRVI
jgi:2-keto-4-pentenoate hydratase/2-oxohepta-3-ene-1,7-dioic acid hydratase in catechol pathway